MAADDVRAREKIKQVFQFLQAFNEKKNPVKRQVRDQPWFLWFRDIPTHPSVQIAVAEDPVDQEPDGIETLGSDDEFVLRVTRPRLVPPPEPPSILHGWLEGDWRDSQASITLTAARTNETGPEELFEDEPDRSVAAETWLRARNVWVAEEGPPYAAFALFERLYALHGQLERESERYELVLGDGIINWELATGGLHHPIVLQRLRLEYEPRIPRFDLVEDDRPVEFYASLFRPTNVSGDTIRTIRQDLEDNSIRPLGQRTTSEFLGGVAGLIAPNGEFLGETVPTGEYKHPRIFRSPVVILRARTQGYAAALEAILEDLEGTDDINGPAKHYRGRSCRGRG